MRRVVHEIRNHLAVAIANIEAFRDGVFEPTPARLAAVLQALGEVDVLVGELPRGEAAGVDLVTRAQRFDVCAVISNEVTAFDALARERGIDFSVDQCAACGDACSGFDGDPVRVAEIVANVVGNAIRYTAVGGRIHVDCRGGVRGLALTVTDGGPGVEPDELRRIFESGYRGSAAQGIAGSGEGLALTAQFVADHGGSIAVSNAPGGGAIFSIDLPGTPPAIAAGGIISLL
jgi:signal transduction histidine kinase